MTATRQTAIGLTLAALIGGAWLAAHVWGVFFHRWSGWGLATAVPLIALQTWLGAGMFIVAHDAMHGSLAPGRPRVNRIIGQLAVGLYAAFPFKLLNSKHHEHHRSPGSAEDPDFHPEAPAAFWPWYLRFFKTYFGWPQLLIIQGLTLLYVLVLGASVANVLAFWAVPSLLSSVQLFAFGTWLPHRHDGQPFADRHNARTQEFGWLLSLLTCFHFGYHREHHLHPTAPWWRLPAMRAQRRGRMDAASRAA